MTSNRSVEAIAPRFLRACRETLASLSDEAGDVYFRELDRRRPAIETWIHGRPQSHRGYLRKLHDFGQLTAATTATSGFDHALTLSRLCAETDDPQLWSYLTLARAASEAFVRAAHLSDISVIPEMTVVRSAAYCYAGWLEQLKLARSFVVADMSVLPAESREGMQDGLERALKNAYRIEQREAGRIQRAGLKIIQGKDGPKAVAGPTSQAQLAFNVTEESNRRLVGVPVPYRIASAGAHSSAWFLMAELVDGPEAGALAMPNPNLLATAVVVTLESLLAIVTAVAQEPETVSGVCSSRLKAVRRVFHSLDEYHPEHAQQTWPE